MVDPTAKYFECTDVERAAFEAGIKLGAIYHQFVGAPVSVDNAELLARTIEAGARLQPYVEQVRVGIDPSKGDGQGAFSYGPLTGAMLEVEVSVRYGGAVAQAAMRYEEELRYPLMRIEAIRREAPKG